jgi:hypothetical protein
LWHDRAVFHFLTAAKDQEKYLHQVSIAVKAAGFLLIATFGPEGPMRCSGLAVARYSVERLVARFQPAFTLLRSRNELHHTPSGQIQSFTYILMQRSKP